MLPITAMKGYGHNSGKPSVLGWGVFQVGCEANDQSGVLKQTLLKELNWTEGVQFHEKDFANINGMVTLAGPDVRISERKGSRDFVMC